MDPWDRCILHVDMDAFFASVEVLDNPSLAGKPVVVGGSSDQRGVVAAASYEARTYGIRSAMPMARAMVLCPTCIRVPARHGRYSAVSKQVFQILGRFASAVEPVSVDEAYLDVTGSQRLHGEPRSIAAAIKHAVRAELGLTCSVGVATNRLVAKIASDLDKPDGMHVVIPGMESSALAPLDIECLPGIGPKTAESLHRMGIHTLGQLAAYPETVLEDRFGSHGPRMAHRASGRDDAPVVDGWDAKSVSAEATFGQFIGSLDDVDRALLDLADDVAARTRADGLQGRRVTIKIRDDRFSTKTRSRTLSTPTDLGRVIAEVARSLYRASPVGQGRAVRLLGIALSRLTPADTGQVDLFDTGDSGTERVRRAERAMDDIRRDLGPDALLRGRALEGRTDWKGRRYR